MSIRKVLPLVVGEQQRRYIGDSVTTRDVNYFAEAKIKEDLPPQVNRLINRRISIDYNDTLNAIGRIGGRHTPEGEGTFLDVHRAEVKDPGIVRFLERCHAEPKLGHVALMMGEQRIIIGDSPTYGFAFVGFSPDQETYEAWPEVRQTAQDLIEELLSPRFPGQEVIFAVKSPPYDYGSGIYNPS